MAQKVVVELIDDLDGTPIPSGKGETIDFAVGGVAYSIDLGPKNAKAFRKSLDTHITHPHRRAPASPHHDPERPAAPRPRPRPAPSGNGHWSHGYEISTRGRIPAEIEQAYHDAT
ncbi:MAG TPA: Lsr2 family protein [Aldersonia sp.]